MNTDYQEAWNDVLQQSEFAWWEWDVRTNRVMYNHLKATMLGYQPEDFHDSGYQGFTDLIHPDDFEEAMQAMRDVLQGKTKLYNSDSRIRTAWGNYLRFMDRGIITETDDDGKPVKIRGIVIDLGQEHERGTDIEALLAVFRQSGKTAGGETSFITVCSSCSRVKRSAEWVDLPENLTSMISEQVSHGLCPRCIQALYPEVADRILEEIVEENR
jgi:PAS domain S-box-containing protein